ncbi:MAG: hypothetical protein KGO51_07525 [Alphaproteobacteria bacterium]|nr:hypothetical protein [Alphaproteobacteria bacterium]
MSGASRLKVGRDVPWVTSWSEEAQTGVGRCPSVDGELAIGQAEKAGVGRPLYSRNHLFRQRRSVRELLCPMCGEPTPDDDRWSQTASPTTAGALRARGFGYALPVEMDDDQPLLNCGAIAPLHRACAEAALARCPHLGGMGDRTLKRFPRAWVVIPLTVEARPLAQRGPGIPVVSFLQLVGVEDAA